MNWTENGKLKAIEDLKRSAQSGSSQVFMGTLFELAKIDMYFLVGVLAQLLFDESVSAERIPTAFALLDCEDDRVFDLLADEIYSKNILRRMSAITAVGNLSCSGMGLVIDLKDIAQEENPVIRVAAFSAMRKILIRLSLAESTPSVTPKTDEFQLENLDGPNAASALRDAFMTGIKPVSLIDKLKQHLGAAYLCNMLVVLLDQHAIKPGLVAEALSSDPEFEESEVLNALLRELRPNNADERKTLAIQGIERRLSIRS